MHNEGYNAILDVLTTLTMKVGVLWSGVPCSLVAGLPAFRMKVLS